MAEQWGEARSFYIARKRQLALLDAEAAKLGGGKPQSYDNIKYLAFLFILIISVLRLAPLGLATS